MEKVKILEPFEYIRNETPEEFEDEENERWADRIDGAGMYIGGGLGTILMVATILWGDRNDIINTLKTGKATFWPLHKLF